MNHRPPSGKSRRLGREPLILLLASIGTQPCQCQSIERCHGQSTLFRWRRILNKRGKHSDQSQTLALPTYRTRREQTIANALLYGEFQWNPMMTMVATMNIITYNKRRHPSCPKDTWLSQKARHHQSIRRRRRDKTSKRFQPPLQCGFKRLGVFQRLSSVTRQQWSLGPRFHQMAKAMILNLPKLLAWLPKQPCIHG